MSYNHPRSGKSATSLPLHTRLVGLLNARTAREQLDTEELVTVNWSRCVAPGPVRGEGF